MPHRMHAFHASCTAGITAVLDADLAEARAMFETKWVDRPSMFTLLNVLQMVLHVLQMVLNILQMILQMVLNVLQMGMAPADANIKPQRDIHLHEMKEKSVQVVGQSAAELVQRCMQHTS